MNGGYRRAIPYAADDTPDRLWAGSGPVRWIMRDGKPVPPSRMPVEQRETPLHCRMLPGGSGIQPETECDAPRKRAAERREEARGIL